MSTPIVYVVDHVSCDRASIVAQLTELGYEAWPFSDAGRFAEMLFSLNPGCIVLDMDFPEGGGLSILDELIGREFDWPVIATSAHSDLSTALSAMKRGAIDFLQKPLCSKKLEAALTTGSASLERSAHAITIRRIAEERIARLSTRELEIGLALLRGLPNKLAAHQLGVSVRTIEMHRAHMLRKLGVRSLAQGAVMLTHAGLVPAEFTAPLAPATRSRPSHAVSRHLEAAPS